MKKIGLLLTLATAIIISSCQKEAVAPSFNADNQTAQTAGILATPVTAVINGVYGTLPSMSDPVGGPWDSAYYSLENNDSTSSPKEIALTNQFNGNISARGSYVIGYKDIANTSLSAITRSSLTGTTLKANKTLGRNVAGDAGWYTYTTPGSNPSVVADRYVVVASSSPIATADFVYVIKLTSIVSQLKPGDTSKGRGVITFSYVSI